MFKQNKIEINKMNKTKKTVKICNQEFVPRSSFARVCSYECALIITRIKQKNAQDKIRRKETKQARDSIKTKRDWLKEAQTAFNGEIKEETYRSKKYLCWIKTLPCVATGAPADDAHHITGTGKGGIGTKPPDNYCIPLTRWAHSLLHQDPKKWEKIYGKQSDHLKKILERAKNEYLN